MLRHALIFALSVIVVVSGCSKRQADTIAAADAGILLLGNGEEPNSLDPHIAASVSEAHILYALFEGLVSHNPDLPQKVTPGVAASWQISADGRRYSFKLRENAKWSDGSTVTARDFVRSVQRAIDPEFGAIYPEMFFDLENARTYFQGEIKSFSQVGIKALSDFQLDITLENPSRHFLQKLKHFAWLPIPTDSVSQYGDWLSRSTRWATQERLVSNGPFVLSKWIRNSILETSKASHYWDSANVILNGIRFFPFEDAQIEYQAFKAKQLHVTDKIPSEVIYVEAQRSYSQKSDPFLATSYLVFNTSSAKLADSRLRKALGLAIDKESLSRDILRSGRAAPSFTPDNIDGYSPPQSPNYNPKSALQIFNQLYSNSTDAPELTLVVSNSPASRSIAEALQAMWQETLGLHVNLLNMEAKTMFSNLNTGNFEISFLSWTGDYEDPTTFLEVWNSANTKNRARWENSNYDNLLVQAGRESEVANRMNLLSKAESILLEEAPIIPLIWKSKDYCLDERVKNWPPALLDMRSYKRVSLTPKQ